MGVQAGFACFPSGGGQRDYRGTRLSFGGQTALYLPESHEPCQLTGAGNSRR